MFIGDDSEELVYNPNQAPVLHQAFPGVRPPSLARRAKFLEFNDIKIKDGVYKPYEDAKIIENYNNFLNFYKIQDSTAARCALFGLKLEDPESDEIVSLVKQLIKPCGFYFRLAHDLPNRLISSVVARARKLFNPFRKQKELDKETKKEIIEYAKTLKDVQHIYVHIANKFNIDPMAARRIVRRRISMEEIEYNSKNWSRSENIRLLDAICKYLGVPPNEITRQLIMEGPVPWTQVSKDVRTRCPTRCQDHAFVALIDNLPAMIKAVIKRRSKKIKAIENE